MKILSTNELYKLSTAELKELTAEQINIANQNIRELEDTGYATISQAYQRLSSKQGREKPSFSTNLEGLDRPSLVARYTASSSYNALRTANVFGTKETNVDIYMNMGYTKEQAEIMVKAIAKGEKIIDERGRGIDIKQFWKNYRELEETGLTGLYDSKLIQTKLRQYMEQTQDDTITNFKAWLDEEFERDKARENEQEQEENERLWGEEIEDEF